MRKLLMFSMVIMLFAACKTAYYGTTANVVYLSGDRETISMRSTGIGNDEQNAQAGAEISAIEVLFFRGLPNSKQKDPLISIDEEGTKAKYSDYFNKFFNQGRYRTFIISSYAVTSLEKVDNKTKSMAVDVTVNLKALRLDLENHGVIRKFGY
jgi:hypothetical protein